MSSRMRVTRRSVSAIAAAAVAVSLAAALPSSATSAGSSVVAFARDEVAYYKQGLPPGVADNCLKPAGRPAPGTAAWERRDLANQYCATLRLRDQLDSPAFFAANVLQGNSLYLAQLRQQLGEPHLRLLNVNGGCGHSGASSCSAGKLS